jgi:hypothetical protein
MGMSGRSPQLALPASSDGAHLENFGLRSNAPNILRTTDGTTGPGPADSDARLASMTRNCAGRTRCSRPVGTTGPPSEVIRWRTGGRGHTGGTPVAGRTGPLPDTMDGAIWGIGVGTRFNPGAKTGTIGPLAVTNLLTTDATKEARSGAGFVGTMGPLAEESDDLVFKYAAGTPAGCGGPTG